MKTGFRACLSPLLFLLVAPIGARAQVQSLTLDHGWEFRQASTAEQPSNQAPITYEPPAQWRPATVPGDVHLDLLAQKLIPDPFFGTNVAKLQWISTADWEYRTSFTAAPSLTNRAHVELVFEGLDAFALVYLNDKLILTADNQFRIWRLDAKPFLKAGPNILRVVFPAQDKAAATTAQRDPWYPRNTVPARSYLRKAAYEHGWDWGPVSVTSGIWRPVRIEAWTQARIADLYVKQNDVSSTVAHLAAQVEIEAGADAQATVEITSTTPTGAPGPKATQTLSLHAGRNVITLPVDVTQPLLWYPAGYGAQPLYTFKTSVRIGNDIETRSTRIGLRSLELRRDVDQWGRSFEFVVNGIPIFAKGADVIPSDSFANRVTPAQYRAMLVSARDANMNMVRLWGGGYYEADDLCDELGILVWHDFMFGNEWQPGTYDFKLSVAHEAEDQLRRLRNHPSIVLWCGNNETEIAFHWLDRDKLDPAIRLQMWQDYLALFDGTLAQAVARFDPSVPYWPSSPSADLEPTSPTYESGDEHIWDVWHGRVPFSTYEQHHARFVSEFGFQSFPEMRTIESFTRPEDRTSIFTPVMLSHQKNNEGNSIIHDYLLRDYAEPKDFASFLYVSEILQAEGIKLGAEHFRRDRPRTIGSIFWQLNDCWPVASWSSIDYFGRWKALQFYAKRFYAPVLVSPHVEDGSLAVYAVSDRTASRSGTLLVQHLRFDGKVLSTTTLQVTVPPLSSTILTSIPLTQLSLQAGGTLEQSFVVATLTVAGEPVSRNLIYLLPTRQIKLPTANVTAEVAKDGDELVVKLRTDQLARSVRLVSSDDAASFEDNYFDLLPGEIRSVPVRTKSTAENFQKTLRVMSLADAFSSASASSAPPDAKQQ
jgi:beta-mannosidase